MSAGMEVYTQHYDRGAAQHTLSCSSGSWSKGFSGWAVCAVLKMNGSLQG